ncbi:MAG: aspartate aminotransferase family protein [Acidobacteriota bacterium]
MSRKEPSHSLKERQLRERDAPLDLSPEEFRKLGRDLVDEIADFLTSLPERPVTAGESLAQVRQALNADRSLPEQGMDPGPLLTRTARLLFDHSLFNGHPRFFGYITSSAAPIGALADLLAATVNPNVGAWALSPMASEIESQTVRWIAELVGYPTSCGGLLVSGGNMANFACFLAARTAQAGWDVRKVGLAHESSRRLLVYASAETHTWIHKASDLCGLGVDSIRWIPVDEGQRMDVAELRRQMEEDLIRKDQPFLVVGTAGSVSTGAIDPLPQIAAICREFGVWFHVDGAYGAFAAMLPDAPSDLLGLSEADSLALDPHKWLYAPLEAGCVLVRDSAHLPETFSYHPSYYHFGDEAINYVDHGPQNSRGFRALKVWLALQQVGSSGYIQMLSDDIQLARFLFRSVADHEELEAMTQSLSITTFRYVPPDLRAQSESEETAAYLNRLNQEVLTRLEKTGEIFLSNAMIDGKFLIRSCIVNFRASRKDVEKVVQVVIRLGREVDQAFRLQC